MTGFKLVAPLSISLKATAPSIQTDLKQKAMEATVHSDCGLRIFHERSGIKAGSLIPHMRCSGRCSLPCNDHGFVRRTRMHIKQPSFDSVNAEFSIAKVVVELRCAGKACCASFLRFDSASAPAAAA